MIGAPLHRGQPRDVGADDGDGFHAILENLNHASALSRTLALPCLWAGQNWPLSRALFEADCACENDNEATGKNRN